MPCTTCDYYAEGPDWECPDTSVGTCCVDMGRSGVSYPRTDREANVGCADHSARETPSASGRLVEELIPAMKDWIASLNTVPPCPLDSEKTL